mgnify:CR=1 FL=1
MIIFQSIPIDEFQKKQTEALREMWYACDPNQLSIPVEFSQNVKKVNEEQVSDLLAWLEKKLSLPIINPEERRLISRETGEKIKNFSREVFDLSDDQVNCFHNLGIDQVTGEFYRRARNFDPQMDSSDIYQACRNVWTSNYLQALLNLPVVLTPALFAYSMLYPVSDNYLDDPRYSHVEKIAYNERFRTCLNGEMISPMNPNERQVLDLVRMIESQYPRNKYPQVYDSLIAIHTAQDRSMRMPSAPVPPYSVDVLGLSFGKGGTSVLADGVLAAGELRESEMGIIFNFGAFAQLMDDQEDMSSDLHQNALTIFTEAARTGKADLTMRRLFCFAHQVLSGMDSFDNERVRPLKQMSMKGIDLLMIDGILRMEKYYSKAFLMELETHFPVRFKFMNNVRSELKKKKITLNRMMGLFADE